ncbi:hypothetical protein [Yersinia pseudotuberculosis]|uniref:hypothetical protein n=1 Tax=Yersinia pseudotuberculosis TaxID=633 RepID=UPI001D12E7DB|nr:hypothetical protein [Yersinia pseudotuberculosis]
MDKLEPCEVADVLFNLSRMLEVAQLMICEPDGEEIGLDILAFCTERAAKGRKTSRG